MGEWWIYDSKMVYGYFFSTGGEIAGWPGEDYIEKMWINLMVEIMFGRRGSVRAVLEAQSSHFLPLDVGMWL